MPRAGAVRARLQVAGVLLVGLDDARVRAEERMLRHVWGVAGRRWRLARSLGHGPYVMGCGATAAAQVAHAKRERVGGELGKLLAAAGAGVEGGGEGMCAVALGI